MFYHIFKEFAIKKKLISVYTDISNSNNFAVGYLVALSSSHILLAHISPGGKYDGYIIKKLEDIYLVEVETQYLKCIEKLYFLQNQSHFDINYLQEMVTEDIVETLLDFAMQRKLVVTIQLVNSGYDDLRGLIQSMDEEKIAFRELNEFGEEAGIAYFNIQDVTFIACDTEDEHKIRLLYSEQ